MWAKFKTVFGAKLTQKNAFDKMLFIFTQMLRNEAST